MFELGDVGLHELWTAFSLDADHIHLLQTLKLRFSKDRLIASSHLKDVGVVLDMVCTALMGTCQFIEWSDLGWVSVGCELPRDYGRHMRE